MKSNGLDPNPNSFSLGQNPLLSLLGGGAVGATSGVARDAPGLAGMPYLTPDALMLYCETKLHDIDSQMQTQFKQENDNYATQQVLSRVGSEISSLSSGFSTDDKDGSGLPHAGPKLLKELNSEIAAAQEPLKGQLTEIRDKVASAIGGSQFAEDAAAHPEMLDDMIANGGSDTDYLTQHGYTVANQSGTTKAMINAETVQSWTSDVKSLSDGMNNMAQMGMIKLQELMSQRQTAIQLCTNLVQSLDDQTNKVVGNVGH